MFKKIAALCVAVLLTLSASSAFATFADLELIRVYYDRNGSEIATDLGKVKDLIDAPGTTIPGSFGSLATGFAAYFALDRNTNELWGSGSTATVSVILGNATGLTGIKNGTTSMYTDLNTQGGTNYTGLASAINSYKNKMSASQGSLGNAINTTTRVNTEASIAGLIAAGSGSVTQTLYYWVNGLTTVTAEKNGVPVASIITHANGATTIGPPIIPPTVTSLSPASQALGTGPTTVTITGTGFASGATVTFSGSGITVGTLTVVDSSTITVPVTIAADALTGSRSVTVANTDLGSVTKTGGFAVIAAVQNPTVTSTSPTSKNQGTGPDTVTINGTGFASGATVSFSGSGVTAGAATFVDANTLTVPVTVAAEATLGARDVTVTNTDSGSGTGTGLFTVTPIMIPTISWDQPASITYGTALSATQLNATASVAGIFAYNQLSGAVLNAGIHMLSVTFTPTDAAIYAGASKNVSLTVNPATLNVTADAKSKVFGDADPLLTYSVTGFVNGETSAIMTGNLTRTTGENVGSYTINQGSVAAGGNYTIVYAGATLTITKATPTITWPSAAAISYGQTLASTTLTGGSASTAGSFAFTAPATAPGVGTALHGVTFTPTDASNYNSVTGTVSVTVNAAVPTGIIQINNEATDYGSIDMALDAIVIQGKTVKVRDLVFLEDITMTSPVTIILNGGYPVDGFGSSQPPGTYTTIAGSMKIRSGTLKVDRIRIK